MFSVKVAVTDVAEVRVTTQVPVPEQPPPLQPVKVEPTLESAVRVMVVPCWNCELHVAPQVMPDGELVIVPDPLPVFETESA